jgi:DnaJ-class molecular chaperone
VRVKLDVDCFADEIAIDFPSVGHLVARARDRFVSEHEGSRGEMLTAEVSLSSREARRGATLPLELAVQGVCQRCGGRGGTWAELCGSCSGSGARLVRHLVSLTVPPHVTHGARFHLRVPNEHSSVHIQVTIAVRTSP